MYFQGSFQKLSNMAAVAQNLHQWVVHFQWQRQAIWPYSGIWYWNSLNSAGSRASKFERAGRLHLLTAVTFWVSSCKVKQQPQPSHWTLIVDRLKSISYDCSQDLFKKFCMCQCKNNRTQKGSETVNIRVIIAKQLGIESHKKAVTRAQYSFSSRF